MQRTGKLNEVKFRNGVSMMVASRERQQLTIGNGGLGSISLEATADGVVVMTPTEERLFPWSSVGSVVHAEAVPLSTEPRAKGKPGHGAGDA